MRWMKTENSTEQRKSGRNSLIPRTKHLIPAHIPTSHSTLEPVMMELTPINRMDRQVSSLMY